jgi:succinoglycan biosynthesis protein ExoU
MAVTEAHRAAIVIAAFNAEATIARAIRSALAEIEVAEVCVVDDASSDATLAAARACDPGDGRLQVIARAENGGPSSARNMAIEATRSPWIGVLDADDFLLAGRTRTLLEQAHDADLIADALIRVASPAAAPAADTIERPAPVLETLSLERFVLGNLTPRKGALELGFLKPLMRRSFLDAHGLRYRPELRLGEDYELYARALALGGRLQLTGPTGYVSVARDGSLSAKHGVDDLRRLRDCDLGLAGLRPLAPGERRALRRHTESVDCRLQWRLMIDAVKARDVGAALKTFRSPATAVYLTARLAEQAVLRSRSYTRSRLQASGPAR